MMKRKIVMMILMSALSISAYGRETTESRKSAESVESVELEKESESGVVISEKLADKSGDVETVALATDKEDAFTNRDLEQEPELEDAEYITVTDGKDISISSEGVYVLSGEASEVTVTVEAGDEDKVQLVTDGLKISNTDSPCIYVKNADKVFITSVSDDNELTVSGSFTADGDTNTDAVIFSKDDLVLNGTGTVVIDSSDNGIAGKDDVKLTGGKLMISCKGSAIEAHDEILIADADIVVSESNDGIHAENDDDDTVGNIMIYGGSLNITAVDDGIHATTAVTVDNGEIVLKAAEGIEGTQIQINGGTVDITASDDGINAAKKSSALTPLFEMNGGDVSIAMGAGDTDGVDSNGDIVINGGTISITGQSTFDYDGNAEYNGGTIIENGKETNAISNQMMGGCGGMRGMGKQGDFGENGEMPDFGGDGELPEMKEFEGGGKMHGGGNAEGMPGGGHMGGKRQMENEETKEGTEL